MNEINNTVTRDLESSINDLGRVTGKNAKGESVGRNRRLGQPKDERGDRLHHKQLSRSGHTQGCVAAWKQADRNPGSRTGAYYQPGDNGRPYTVIRQANANIQTIVGWHQSQTTVTPPPMCTRRSLRQGCIRRS